MRPRLIVTKKRLLLIAFLPLIAAVVLGILSILPSSPGVTKANFDRIEKGMTKAEVEVIFGEKGDWWDGAGQKGRPMYWTAKDGSGAVVEFVDECVAIKQWAESRETVLDKLRRWLCLP
jgi:hypothetical protein